MRPTNDNLFNAIDGSASINSSAIPTAFMTNCSIQSVVTGTVTGTLKIQVSNDAPNILSVTNWTDLTGASSTLSSATTFLISIQNLCYQWLRAVYTVTSVGTQTVTTIADTGVAQVQTVATVADSSGSLNSKYFTLSSVNATTKARKDFYLWLDNGSGVDPAPAGKTGIHVTYTNNDTANTIASDIRTALNALTNDFVATGSNQNVIITNAKPGLVPAAADSTAATGFTFNAPSTPGVNSNLNNTYFLLNSAGNATKYYVWYNIASLGTDPLVAGRTAIAVTGAASVSANTLATSTATAVAAANSSNDFTASASSAVVTITNKVVGQFTPAVDGAVPTGFAFATTADVGTVSANLFGFGMN